MFDHFLQHNILCLSLNRWNRVFTYAWSLGWKLSAWLWMVDVDGSQKGMSLLAIRSMAGRAVKRLIPLIILIARLIFLITC